MKEKLKRFTSFIFHLKFGFVLIFLVFIFIVYRVARSIYIDFRYHFSDIVSGSSLLVGMWRAIEIDNKFTDEERSRFYYKLAKEAKDNSSEY